MSNLKQRLTPFERSFLKRLQPYSSASEGVDREAVYEAAKEMTRIAPTPQNLNQYAVDACLANRARESISINNQIDPSKGTMREDWHYWDFLTQAHHMLDQHDQELKEAQRGRELHPNKLPNRGYEIRALAALGRVEEVKSRVEKVLGMPTKGYASVSIVREAARELRRHGNRQAALDVLQRALDWLDARPAQQKNATGFHYHQAAIHYDAENWDKAQNASKKLHRDFPTNVWYVGRLGAIAARKGDREEALRFSEILAGMSHGWVITFFNAQELPPFWASKIKPWNY